MDKRQVVVIHGGETFDTYNQYLEALRSWEYDPMRPDYKDWKKRLPETLGETFDVLRPSMPSKYNAKYEEWKIWFEKIVPYLRDGVVLVGHSLGGLFLAKYLSENDVPVRISSTYLVAAPYAATDSITTLADFALPNSLEKFSAQGGRIHLYHSTDDTVVPYSELSRYQAALPHARASVFADRAHFNQEEFPELVAEIMTNV
ncbi:MAG TPA: alpha/beta hydrolase [Candidatus Paceibacterota bacterium]|nr:alpha/beta hydrolase [Candidatus Paceibacterota bacterium]